MGHRHMRLLVFTGLLLANLSLYACDSGDDSTPVPGVDVVQEDVLVVPDVSEIKSIAITMSDKPLVSDEALVPTIPHLTWQSDPSSTVTVQWRISSTDLDSFTSKVWFAREDEVKIAGEHVTMPYDVEHVVEAEPILYEFPNMFEFFYFPEVELTDLEPDTRYYYRAGTWQDVDEDTGALVAPSVTRLHSFRTGLPKGSSEPFRFVAAGDSRGGYERITEEAHRLFALDTAFWLFNGDMTTTGMPLEWVTWFEAMGPLTSDTVLMPVPGNHEIFIDLYYALFALPRRAVPEENNPEMGWSFVYGNTLFVALDSTAISMMLDTQVEWLRETLESYKDDPDIRWRVVTYHHSAYSSSNHEDTERVQVNWVPIMEEFGVDLAFAGHDHNYERTIPILANEPAPDGQGIVHVVAGGFFAPGYSPGNNWYTHISHHGDKNNYCVIEVDEHKLKLTAYDGRGEEVLDQFELTK